ncbi:hypothetical protein HNQ60_005389 [Povalibacter uvarum]|uniref:Uncharacterized protein n=1 Tax=Povalibacter uvarum TaxID=732238 RepID=A0A841HT03_9GAMM|nr:hypothetical protein [Povalibacter uvarum]MBB6096467.1 hypothetical protein [Povalibacter uvarum]
MNVCTFRIGTIAIALAFAPINVPAAESANVRELMLKSVVPASDAVFTAAATPPERAEEWTALKAAITQLSDDGRTLKDARTAPGEDWARYSKDLIAAASQALAAANQRDAESLSTAGDAVYVRRVSPQVPAEALGRAAQPLCHSRESGNPSCGKAW